MSVTHIKTGDTLRIRAQLDTGEAGLFVRATLSDEAGTQIKTVGLSDVGGGLYLDSGESLSTEAVYIKHEVFLDAGHTVPDETKKIGFDTYLKDDSAMAMLDKLDYIIARISGLALPGANISARISAEEAITIVRDLNQVAEKIEDTEIITSVKTDGQHTVSIQSQEIATTVNCDKG